MNSVNIIELPYELILTQLIKMRYSDINNFCKIDEYIYTICKKELPRLTKKWLIDFNITLPGNVLFALNYCKCGDSSEKKFFTFIKKLYNLKNLDCSDNNVITDLTNLTVNKSF